MTSLPHAFRSLSATLVAAASLVAIAVVPAGAAARSSVAASAACRTGATRLAARTRGAVAGRIVTIENARTAYARCLALAATPGQRSAALHGLVASDLARADYFLASAAFVGTHETYREPQRRRYYETARVSAQRSLRAARAELATSRAHGGRTAVVVAQELHYRSTVAGLRRLAYVTATTVAHGPSCVAPNVDAQVVHQVEPEYPDEAVLANPSGTATLAVALAADGGVQHVSVERSSGSAVFDASAMRAARESRYRGKIVRCVPTASVVEVQSSFTP